MSEYHPDFEDYRPPYPNTPAQIKDTEVEEKAIKEIMTLALYGAVMKATKDSTSQFDAVTNTTQLFKDAGLIL